MRTDRAAFERLIAEECAHLPKAVADKLVNVVLLAEDEPSAAVRAEEGLAEGETLLGLYHGIPATERGDFYSGVLPDSITLYRLPLLEEAQTLVREGRERDFDAALRLAIRETIWHEVGHYFGLSEDAVDARERSGTNRFHT